MLQRRLAGPSLCDQSVFVARIVVNARSQVKGVPKTLTEQSLSKRDSAESSVFEKHYFYHRLVDRAP